MKEWLAGMLRGGVAGLTGAFVEEEKLVLAVEVDSLFLLWFVVPPALLNRWKRLRDVLDLPRE